MHCSYWAQILFQRDWFFLISVCSRSIIVCQFPIMLWINKAAATIRRILYGWRILCCFFPCFLILASGQFLNIAGWTLFYATIHMPNFWCQRQIEIRLLGPVGEVNSEWMTLARLRNINHGRMCINNRFLDFRFHLFINLLAKEKQKAAGLPVMKNLCLRKLQFGAEN